MTVTINGTTGLAGVDGSAGTPAIQGGDANTGMFFPAADTIAFATAGTEDMRIDSSGKVGIGTTTLNGKLNVLTATDSKLIFNDGSTTGNVRLEAVNNAYSAYKPLETNGSVQIFATGATERMRIDSSGNLLVATTSTSLTSDVGIKFINGASSNAYMGIVNSGTDAGRANYHLYSTGAGAYRFYVTMGGVINATSTSITAISDQRLKENIRNLDIGLSEIMALKPRKFDWKEGKGLNKKDDFGFIAQEFETVFPSSVTSSKAGEDGIEYKAINHSELIPTLVKAIQEQQALITALTARITVLENK